jgi:hypothetical protein
MQHAGPNLAPDSSGGPIRAVIQGQSRRGFSSMPAAVHLSGGDPPEDRSIPPRPAARRVTVGYFSRSDDF